ncbi:MAG: IS1 family transposase [Planctomycetaceae bacterium]|nr:IS1 family transposase [Planctomycetaceae bacterium]
MECPNCSTPSRKFGFTSHGTQRFRCDQCRKTFTPEKENPLGVMRLEMDKAVSVIRALVEGCSVRSTQRMTNVAKHTILALLVHVGSNCKRMLEDRLTDVKVNDIEGDEIWNFVGCKERTKVAKQLGESVGDSYTFVGIERTTKLVVAWHLGKRSHDDTVTFAHKLSHATSGHFQMTTDGFAPYKKVIPDTFGSRVDFSQLIKVYGKEGGEEQRRYSPPVVTKIDYQEISGSPKHDRASTSFVERSNLSIRMGVRRFTRLTNGFSKKWKNHEAALALWFAYYNYSRKHMTLKETPAMASGLADHVWTIRELIEESAKH